MLCNHSCDGVPRRWVGITPSATIPLVDLLCPPNTSAQRRGPEGGPKARPEGLVRLQRFVVRPRLWSSSAEASPTMLSSFGHHGAGVSIHESDGINSDSHILRLAVSVP